MGLMELSLDPRRVNGGGVRKDRKFQSRPGASHDDFSRLNEVTSPRSVSVTLAKGPEQDQALRSEGIHGGRHRRALALPKKRHGRDEGESEAKAEEEGEKIAQGAQFFTASCGVDLYRRTNTATPCYSQNGIEAPESASGAGECQRNSPVLGDSLTLSESSLGRDT